MSAIISTKKITYEMNINLNFVKYNLRKYR